MYFEVTYNFHTRLISFYFIFPTIVNRVYFKLRSSERFGSKKSTDIHLTVIQSTSYILPKYVKNIHSKLEAWRVKTSQTTGTLRLRFFFQRLRQFSIPITTSSRKSHLIYHREFSGDTGSRSSTRLTDYFKYAYVNLDFSASGHNSHNHGFGLDLFGLASTGFGRQAKTNPADH